MKQIKAFGYIRVSTKEQKGDRQRIALLERGIPETHIYMDKLSGKDFARPQYQKLLQKLDCDSVLFVKSIYDMYEFSDKFQFISQKEQYGSMFNYVKTGILTYGEMFEAMLH